MLDTTISEPQSAAPRAMATSPSGWAARCRVVGATANGEASVVPSTVADVSTEVTSRSTCGSSRNWFYAATDSAALTPSRAPWRK